MLDSYKENIKYAYRIYISADFGFPYIYLIEFCYRMNIAVIREKIRRAALYIPFRVHLLLLVVALFFLAGWLRKNNAVPETAQTAILDLFISVTCWFASAILLVSFVSAFIPWIIFVSGKKNQRSILKIKTAFKEHLASQQQVEVNISNIIKPPFGYIRLRLLYDGNHVSPKFAPIAMEAKNNFFTLHTKGLYNWPLKNIREYDVNSGIIYFEDFFQFFSFTGKLPSNSNFFNAPSLQPVVPLSVQPKKTEDTSIRIDEVRKVEGELLNYKNFETNDDVRRIVWKIYAKNKELVVKIPETNDPYASHIYFYASFYNALSSEAYREFNEAFLDKFKTITWNIYDQLSRQNALIQYIADQELKQLYTGDPALAAKYTISTASWHQQNSLENYFNRQYASLLCISSLADAQQLSRILDKSGRTLTVVFVRLSKSFAGIRASDWMQWLFVRPQKNSLEKLQLAFNLSPLRKKILENENSNKQIKKLAKKLAKEYQQKENKFKLTNIQISDLHYYS